MMKICSKCGEEKELSEFYKRKISKDGYMGTCKECEIKRVKEYQLNNNQKVVISRKNYRNNNLETMKEKQKKYYNENKEQINKIKRIKVREKYKTDPIFKIKYKISGLIRQSIKSKNGYTEKSKLYKYLGCPYNDFIKHMEELFEVWMTWENWSGVETYRGGLNETWDIDHIIPLSSVNTVEGIIELNHYTNLQPLCSKVNRDIKKDKQEKKGED